MASKIATIEAQEFLAALDSQARESVDNTDFGWNTVYNRGDASATYTGGNRGPRWWRGVPSIYDRDEGRYFPFYVEERDLEEMRAKSRALATFTSVAIGAIQATMVYTMGGQWEYKFTGKKDAPQQPSKELLAELNAVLAATLDRNQWVGEFDCELHDQSREVGDVLVAAYAGNDGICDFRRKDGDAVRQPANEKRLNDWLDASPKNSWTFGVHTIFDERMRRIDHERAIGYHVVEDDGGREWDYLPAWPQCHGDATLINKFGHLIKRNTPRSAKRGISDFWPVQTDLERDAKLSENLAVGAAVLASIPWFENYAKGTTRDQAERSLSRGLDQYSKAISANRQSNGESRSTTTRPPGTVVKASAGIERTMGPLGQVRQPIYIEVCQHLRRSIGLRWLMPEYMISGDASNANFASTLVSESPFVKAREADQRFFIAHFKAMLWKAIKIAFDYGRFSKFAVKFGDIVGLCDLAIQPPMVASRDKAAQLAELQQLWEAGLLKGNEYRIDLKREPKPEYEAKTYAPPTPMLPGPLTDGLAAAGAKKPPGPPDDGGEGGQPAKPKQPGPEPPGGGAPQPKAAGDRQAQLRAEAFSRAIESAQTLGEARAIAGRFRVALEDCGTGAGGFKSGNDCAGGDGGTDEATGLPLNDDGTVTLYHGTTADGEAAIKRDGGLRGREDGVFLTTSRADVGYGDRVVAIRVKPEMLELDDEFPDGRKDFRIPAKVGALVRAAVDAKPAKESRAVENCGTGAGGFQPGNDCQCDDCAGGGELEDYTTDKFQDVNSALRSGNVDKSTADFVKRLDATIAKAPKRAGVTLRSFDIEGDDGKKIAAMLTEGGTFTDAAYMSTRKTPTLTDSIAFKQKKMAAGQVVLRVEGKSGVDISAISKNPGEGEILYPRGTTFAVRKVHRTESGGILAEIVEQPKAKDSRVLEDCGANAEGGGGFQPGNTCGDDEGDGANADDAAGAKQTETKEFKAWFGESKVVDADGKPLRVYHGTVATFDSFDPESQGSNIDHGKLGSGHYFTEDPNLAGSYAMLSRARNDMAQQILPVYLSVKNPLIIPKGETDRGKNLWDKLRSYSAELGISDDPVTDREANTPNREWAPKFTARLKELGYDGVAVDFGAGKREWVAFKPNQIKSATGNKGKFDPKSDKITEAKR